MEISLPEILDRISIVRLKIERIGEPQLNEELGTYMNAMKEYIERGVNIKKEWLDELYEINGKIWDLVFPIRKIINSENYLELAEKAIGFEELGRQALLMESFMKIRVAVKNRISEETGSGFKDIKIDHCGE